MLFFRCICLVWSSETVGSPSSSTSRATAAAAEKISSLADEKKAYYAARLEMRHISDNMIEERCSHTAAGREMLKTLQYIR